MNLLLRIFLLVTVLALLLSACTDRAQTEDVKKEVLMAFDSLVAASKSLDSKAYFDHFDESKFVGLNSDGTNWNSLDDLRPLIDTGFDAVEKVVSLTFTNVKVSVIGAKTAVLVNEYEQSLVLKNGATVHLSGGGTQVWSKQSGIWKLVSVSASNKARN